MNFFIHPLMGRVWALCTSRPEPPHGHEKGAGSLCEGQPPSLSMGSNTPPDHTSQPFPLAPSGWPPGHCVPRSVVTPKPFSKISFLGEGNVQMHHFQLERTSYQFCINPAN